MQLNLSKVLSFNAGYVDTASFLAIHGLFAAHVTGNFVTLGAALVSTNHAGAWAKLAALPMFCVVVLLTRLLHSRFERANKLSYRFLLLSMLALFAAAAVLSLIYLPFPATDTWPSFMVGMLLVAAMAIQNAMHRMHWAKESPTTVMTGSTTQLMLDLADSLAGNGNVGKTSIKTRIKNNFPNMLGFALGCAIAALVYHYALWLIFIVPVALMGLAYAIRERYKKA